ncbi:6-phosphofructokinase type C, partial [Rozella allomycis CSF55]
GTKLVLTNKESLFSEKALIDKVETKNESPSSKQQAKSDFKRKVAFLMSGGDSCGMNASIRAIVRVAIAKGCDAYAVYEGYQGLVTGNELIKKMEWNDVAGILSTVKGGTAIGTARCKEFRERSGRLKACYNLVSLGIDSLIVNGGDGSLTGADIFRSEWNGLLQELVDSGKITADLAKRHQHLSIVGMVGSIDNDMVGTEMTIGANTSLHRIVEAIDSISSTASSHQRAFIIEVMGRHCGWLALMASLATGADWLFIPEAPPAETWEEDMCDVLKKHRQLGKRKVIIVVSEGALDRNNQPIKCEKIKDVLSKKLNYDTRVTTLGHVQRGGFPTAFDRILATLQGSKAVEEVLSSSENKPSPLIAYNENKITCVPLMEAVQMTLAVAKAVEAKDFKRAFELRDPDFRAAYEISESLVLNKKVLEESKTSVKIAILNCGAPCAGMNAATRAAVRYGLHKGYIVYAVYNGFDGLINGDFKEMKWMDVDGWTMKAGSELGVNRTLPVKNLGMVAYQMQKFGIQGLIIVGGFEAYTSLAKLEENRPNYPAFCIPMVCIPATVSNNVPGTEYSIGSDTALNAIVEACDTIKCSASASRNRVFVVEVQGGRCGYLATLGGLASGAVRTYIHEEGITLNDISNDVDHLKKHFHEDKRIGRIVLRNESVSDTYTTEVLSNIFQEEGTPLFDSKTAVLGHLQQGRIPSPMDRIRGTRFAVLSMQFIENWLGKDITSDSAVVLGIQQGHVVYTPVQSLVKEADAKMRRPKDQWWLSIRPLLKLLAKYDQ